MKNNNKNKIIRTLVLLTIASVFLVACDDAKTKKPAIKVPIQAYQQIKVLKGTIINKNGSVLNGVLKVKDRHGNIVATAELADSKNYSVEIPAGTELPIELIVKQKGRSDKLIAIVISTAVSRYDISSLTTKIAARAKALGGYTYGNMVMAADSTVGVPDANKTSTGFRGDPTKQYGGWH